MGAHNTQHCKCTCVVEKDLYGLDETSESLDKEQIVVRPTQPPAHTPCQLSCVPFQSIHEGEGWGLLQVWLNPGAYRVLGSAVIIAPRWRGKIASSDRPGLDPLNSIVGGGRVNLAQSNVLNIPERGSFPKENRGTVSRKGSR